MRIGCRWFIKNQRATWGDVERFYGKGKKGFQVSFLSCFDGMEYWECLDIWTLGRADGGHDFGLVVGNGHRPGLFRLFRGKFVSALFREYCWEIPKLSKNNDFSLFFSRNRSHYGSFNFCLWASTRKRSARPFLFFSGFWAVFWKILGLSRFFRGWEISFPEKHWED